jgi:hypothetical protein
MPAAPQPERETLKDSQLARLRVLYAPNGSVPTAVIETMSGRLMNSPTHGFDHECQGFATEAELVARNSELEPVQTLQDSLGRGTGNAEALNTIGVVFNSLLPGDVEYTIRTSKYMYIYPPDHSGATVRMAAIPMWVRVTPNEENATRNQLVETGFVTLEHALNEAIAVTVNPQGGSQTRGLRVGMCPRKNYEARYGTGEGGFGFLVKLYLPLAFLTSAQLLTVAIVDEKEKKLQEGMRMMGLSDGAYWASWLASHGLLALFTSSIAAWILDQFGLFPHTGVGWLFALVLTYNLALVPPCVVISQFCSKVTQANQAVNAFTIPLLLSIPLGLIDGHHVLKIPLSIFAPIGLSQSLGRIIELEGRGEGLSWATAFGSNGPDAVGISFAASFGGMVAGIIIFGVLGWYLGLVLPGEYGIKRSWLFPCQQLHRRWRQAAAAGVAPHTADTQALLLLPTGVSLLVAPTIGSASPVTGESDATDDRGGGGGETGGPTAAVLEAAPPDLAAGVVFTQLRKVYEKSSRSKEVEDVTAVDCLDLTLFEGQIFALL